MASASEDQYRLLVQVLQSSWLTAYGGRVERSAAGPVTIYFQGRRIGLWWHEASGFCFAAVPNQPAELVAKTVQDAVAMTLVRVMRSAAGHNARFTRGLATYSAASVPNWSSERRA